MYEKKIIRMEGGYLNISIYIYVWTHMCIMKIIDNI